MIRDFLKRGLFKNFKLGAENHTALPFPVSEKVNAKLPISDADIRDEL